MGGDSNRRRLGFLLQCQAPDRRFPLRSNTGSTGHHDESRRFKIAGRTLVMGTVVPIMHCAACDAGPYLHFRRKRGHLVSAGRADLGRRVETVDHDQRSPVPGTLVLQLGKQFGPCGVRDRTSQSVVAEHVAHRQILDHDHAVNGRYVFANESSGQLVQMIPAPVGDPRMYTGDLHPRLVPVLRTLLLARQFPLMARAFSHCETWSASTCDAVSRPASSRRDLT